MAAIRRLPPYDFEGIRSNTNSRPSPVSTTLRHAVRSGLPASGRSARKRTKAISHTWDIADNRFVSLKGYCTTL
jgi:hypothetical protein